MSDESLAARRLREYREAKQGIGQKELRRKQLASESLLALSKLAKLESELNQKFIDTEANRRKAKSLTKTKPCNDGLRHGDRIPGSRHYRAFCKRCGCAMRVDAAYTVNGGKEIYCETCSPTKPLLNSRATRDESPWQENAIRAMEDQQ